jgi:hypothetical protein
MTTKTNFLIALGATAVVASGVAYILQHKRVAPTPTPVAAQAPVAAKPAIAQIPTDCLFPGPNPVPPYGATASEADMALGHTVIQGYVLQLEAYQACRNSMVDHAGPDVSLQQKQTWANQGNTAVDEANALANAFAAQIKAYKAAHPG